MKHQFYSNGKLLLSGEYAVLDGALAWAIPTKFGQFLRIATNSSAKLSWKSLDEKGNVWFEGVYEIDTFKVISASDKTIAAALQTMLSQAKQLNASFLTNSEGFAVETELTFPKDWGLGSSSTLINNIAHWANVNAHILLAKTFGGSGYDISCAQHDLPILFKLKDHKPETEEIQNSLSFTKALYFVYLNQKKNSKDGIASYRKRKLNSEALIYEITKLTRAMISSKTIADFAQLMTDHEALLSKALNIPTVKSELFPDFEGAIKSLGAWGGDFILVTGNEETPNYFKSKGYHTVVPFQKMIL